jgi:hypothetical protein
MAAPTVLDLDGSDLPDGTSLRDALRSFRDWNESWCDRHASDGRWHWDCPAAWHRGNERAFNARGVRLMALGRALESGSWQQPERDLRTADPLLGRLARALVHGRRAAGARVRIEAGLWSRLLSRFEPLMMAAWWFACLAVRWATRRASRMQGHSIVLILEPLVAGARDPVAHNWGSSDPVAGATRVCRLQVPIGFGCRPWRARLVMAKVPGAVLPEDVIDAHGWLLVLRSPIEAWRRWPSEVGDRDLGLAEWSGAMRRRLIWSTTLLNASMIDAAVESLARGGSSLERALCWFENQPQERGFTLAVRRRFPGIRVVGHLRYHFSPALHAGIVPTRSQVRAGVIPDEIACTGRLQTNWLGSVCPGVQFRQGSGGRFRVPEFRRDPQARGILLLTPSDDRLALAMIEVMVQAGSLLAPGWRVIVRAHPAHGAGVHAAIGRAGFGRDESSDPGEALRGVSVAVGGGTSMIVLARAAGWPVVILSVAGQPGADPFPPGHGLDGVVTVHDASALSRAVERLHGARPVDVPPGALFD